MKIAKTAQLMCDVLLRGHPSLKECFINSVERLEKWIESEGAANAVKRWKILQHQSILFLTGQPAEKQQDGVWFKTDPILSPAPKLFSPLLEWCYEINQGQDEYDIRLGKVISLLSIVDLIDGKPSENEFEKFKSTAERPKVIQPKDVEAFDTFLNLFLKRNKRLKWVQKLHSFLPQPTIFESTKAGPNAKVSLLGSHRDYYSLYYKDKNLYECLIEFSKVIGKLAGRGHESLHIDTAKPEAWLNSLTDEEHDYFRSLDLKTGVVRMLPAKAGKVRPIAMVDSLTQTIMSPVHDHLMSVLKGIQREHSTDGTYDQDEAVKYISDTIQRNLGGTSGQIITYSASFDQSSCTERFPIDIQTTVISKFLGSEGANLWARSLTDREYICEQEGVKDTVRWKSGQPLGALSSWAAMALSHHLMVQYAAYRAYSSKKSVTYFSQYAILGDDVVILDEKVANVYLSLCKEWGMEINLSKSHVTSKHKGRQLVTEFAKRILINGRQVPVIRSTLFSAALKDHNMVTSLFRKVADTQIVKLNKSFVKGIVQQYWPDMVQQLMYILSLPRTLSGAGLRITGNPKSIFKFNNSSLPTLIPYLLNKRQILVRKLGEAKLDHIGSFKDMFSGRTNKYVTRDINVLLEEINAIPRDVFEHPVFTVVGKVNTNVYDVQKTIMYNEQRLAYRQKTSDREKSALDVLLREIDDLINKGSLTENISSLLQEIEELENDYMRLHQSSSLTSLTSNDPTTDPLSVVSYKAWSKTFKLYELIYSGKSSSSLYEFELINVAGIALIREELDAFLSQNRDKYYHLYTDEKTRIDRSLHDFHVGMYEQYIDENTREGTFNMMYAAFCKAYGVW